MEPMYRGIPFSPQTVLTDSIGAADTIIPVDDVSVFPDAPNYATIGTDTDGETILYAAKAAGALSGCTRGVEGAAKAWGSGAIIARNYTAKDMESLQKNVEDHDTALMTKYSAENVPPYPVKSVNGKTGAVSLSAADVGALPSSTKIPAKTSDLTNDSGFIADYTETDPTVPAWAKAASKPSYTADEVGALPKNTPIPSVVQTTGDSTMEVMSQAAVTNALNALSNEKADKKDLDECLKEDDIFTVTQVTTPDYTNLIPTSEDENGDVFNGTGYMAGRTISGDGSVGENANTYVSGFISVKKGDVIRVKDPRGDIFDETVMFALYPQKSTGSGLGKTVANIKNGTAYGSLTTSGDVVTWDTRSINYYVWSNFAWLRVTTHSPAAVVTVNQELTESTKDQLAFRPEIKVSAENLNIDLADKPLSGKTVALFGDSLIGMYRDFTGVQAYVAGATGATVHNVGFGGCRMSVHPSSGYAAFSMWALAKAIAENDWATQDAQASSGSSYFPEQVALLKSLDFNKVDIAVIHYGTNDFAAGGGVTVDNESDHDDYNTLCGALRYSIEKLLTAYPKLRIYISLPVFRFWDESGVVSYSDTYTRYGHTLVDFCEALRGVAAEYKLPVIDGYNGLGVNALNATVFLSDGTHHTVDGRERFGRFIGASLTAQQEANPPGYSKKEIDSMFGSYVTDIDALLGGGS